MTLKRTKLLKQPNISEFITWNFKRFLSLASKSQNQRARLHLPLFTSQLFKLMNFHPSCQLRPFENLAQFAGLASKPWVLFVEDALSAQNTDGPVIKFAPEGSPCAIERANWSIVFGSIPGRVNVAVANDNESIYGRVWRCLLRRHACPLTTLLTAFPYGPGISRGGILIGESANAGVICTRISFWCPKLHEAHWRRQIEKRFGLKQGEEP